MKTMEAQQIKYKSIKFSNLTPRSINKAEKGKNKTTENLDTSDKTWDKYAPIALEPNDAAEKRDKTTKLSTITDKTNPDHTSK